MKQKIVLKKRAVPLRVNLPNGTSFVARYERISRKNLPWNIRVSRQRTIGPRNTQKWKKKVRFALANTPTQDRVRRIKNIYIGNYEERKLGRTSWKFTKSRYKYEVQINKFSAWKKLIENGIENIPAPAKHGTSKIKNINVQRPLNSDIAKHRTKQKINYQISLGVFNSEQGNK